MIKNKKIVNKKEKKHKLLLGAHMSIAGGYENAIYAGQAIGCTAIQIFTRSNRQWGLKRLTAQEVLAFKKAWENSCILEVVAHCTYLINIGSPKMATLKRSKMALENELQICQALGIPNLVLHPGSRLDSSQEACIKQIAQTLDEVLENNPGESKILLETMAGQGTGVGYKFEQIASIFDMCKHKKRLGVCLDTCHIFAAGYDFRAQKDYENMVQEFDNIIGLKNLKAMHINDSKKDLASKVDRHEEIGQGKLGLEPFKFIFNDERFFDVPKILETPVGTLESYAENMRVIRGLLTPKTKKILGL